MAKKVLATNKRARFDYELQDKYTAGLVLAGHEVKSVRKGNIDIKNAFITLRNNEAWLTNAHIKAYEHSQVKDYDSTRPRKLLLGKREIVKLQAAKQNKLAIVPLNVVVGGRFLKLEIATGRGKKLYDKRETLKRKDAARDMKKAVKKAVKS